MGRCNGLIKVLATLTLFNTAGCMNLSVNPDPAKPVIDHHAVSLIERVKSDPTRVSGGGMIYQLFVGGHFDAKLDQREGTLTLADIETDTHCLYSLDGLLKLPAEIGSEHARYCAELSANTAAILSQ